MTEKLENGDIAKCAGGGCSIRNICFRYTSAPRKIQTWFEPENVEPCDYLLVDQEASDRFLNRSEQHSLFIRALENLRKEPK